MTVCPGEGSGQQFAKLGANIVITAGLPISPVHQY